MGLTFSSFYNWLFNKEYKVVMVGLDTAGKTTILYRLNLGEVITTVPTIGSNVEEVNHRGVRFQVWDLGGQEKLRKVWSTYYVGAHAVVLVIDSMDRERLPAVREELNAITANDELNRAVLLVLANKQDLPGAMSPMEITQQLKLHLNKERAWQIQPCSGLTGTGLFEGMDWVVHHLKKEAMT